MRDIDQFDLHSLFSDPSSLYEQIRNRRGYTPKQVVEFDIELVAPAWSSMNHVLLVAMIHREKRAHIIMLASEDLTALRGNLEQSQIAVNTHSLLSTGHPVFGQFR